MSLIRLLVVGTLAVWGTVGIYMAQERGWLERVPGWSIALAGLGLAVLGAWWTVVDGWR
jgi:hypothetical protein